MSSKKKTDGDDRFLRVQKDPRFWEMPERERKVKIDKRFQSMFHDERFKVKYTVDKRGRPISHTSTEDLKRFYKLSDSEEEEEEEKDKKKKKKAGRGVTDERKNEPERGVRVIQQDEDDEEQRSAEENVDDEDVSASSEDDEESGVDSGDDSDSEPDLARGKGNVETSSDEDEDVDAILRREEEEIEHDWGELCKDAPRSDEVSARLAVCNMDWDRMKAKDLLALLNSFTPPGGAVLSVKIYPSEFGKERLKVEETQGPLELRALPDDSEDDTEEERVYREKMRDYQFKRLKYFYAVVECDSVKTSAKIYEECDGYEYESSCSVLDLRFIPDDVTFDEEPRDVATDVKLSAYTPKLFTSSAAATSKVQLTWDETDHERVTALNRKFNKNQLLDMDFNAYLASSSEEEEEEEEEEEGEDADAGQEEADHVNTAEEELVVEKKPREEDKKKKKKKSEEQISKYRELLKGIQDKEKKLQEDKDMEMEVTWVPGLKEATEQLVKKKLEAKDKLTPWEEFLQKKKERKKQKKSERKQGTDVEQLSDDELPPDVDLSDPFFSEELSAAELQKKKKQKKKKQEEEPTAEEEEELEKQKAQMALLMEDDDAEHKHFNYDKIVEQQNLSKKKRKKLLKKGQEPLEDDDFQVDVKDPRFQAMFTSHLFNLDPSHPSYKRTQATQSILAEKQRRREEEQRRMEDALAARKATPTQSESADQQEAAGKRRQDAPTERKAMDPSLSLLVKSIKSKTEQFQARKKQKLL
ncbi:ESF1 homolog [Acanthochromis polyacanthus]|uniref:ESF1 homolog n=1 Tax=Acanthochromis polyacanthus TaxID=80966 RepID=UPI002234D02C|nr:ESF1 homolog [Acanthochromis polyacanthus]XP_051801531.1 ESF1 homolog [Acanthochromis polyacanthus]XP_051801532.1 ESF1 homolog [Acanthochromis polyacanthus]